MSPADQPSHEHQAGITNAQEQNPDAEIGRLTAEMNALFAAKQYAEAARIALSITAMSKDELRETFETHGVKVLHLDHEAFGTFEGQIEPTYDLHVEGVTQEVLAAAAEFGEASCQEMVLIARKVPVGEIDPEQRLGVTITLNMLITVEEAVAIVAIVQGCGFQGATFAPKKSGTVAIYHTENLGLSPEAFQQNAVKLTKELQKRYTSMQYKETFHILIMVRL